MNATIDQTQSTTGQTRLMWGAIAFLGVIVVAMGATLVQIQGQSPYREPTASAPTSKPEKNSVAVITEAPLPASTAPAQLTPTIVINNHMTPEKAATAARSVPAATINESRVVAKRSETPAQAVQVIAAPAPVPAALPQVAQQVPSPLPQAPAGPVVYSGYPPQTAGAPVATLPTQPPVFQSRPQVACLSCGTVESVTPIQRSAQTGGTGAIAGGVLGAVVGNQIGKGSGRTIGTILGAIGGGFAGNAIEKQMKKETVYQVRVRMDDGSLRTVEQASAPALGSRITLDGSESRMSQAGPGSSETPASSVVLGGDRT